MEQEDVLLERARQLIHLNRKDQAVAELRKLLTSDPHNISALMMITGCLIDLNDMEQSAIFTEKLLAEIPDFSISYYYRAIYLDRINKKAEAEKFIRRAIEIDPYDADYFGFLSALYMEKKEWQLALDYADEGLRCDPEHTTCLNLRTQCLTKLKRSDELKSSIEDTLASDPENAYSHANIGWSKLETGDAKTAQYHFLEALKFNPNSGYAREGMKEIIRARNPVYRLFMNYKFWIAKQSDKFQWMFLVGFVIARRFIVAAAEAFPPVWIIVGILFLMTYLSWIIEPFSNIFLRFDSFGKYALDDDEKKAANITAVCVPVGIIAMFAFYFLRLDFLLYLGIFSLTIVIPLTKYLSLHSYARYGLIKYLTFGLVAVGLISLFLVSVNEGLALVIGTAYIWGFVAYTWIYNYWIQKNA